MTFLFRVIQAMRGKREPREQRRHWYLFTFQERVPTEQGVHSGKGERNLTVVASVVGPLTASKLYAIEEHFNFEPEWTTVQCVHYAGYMTKSEASHDRQCIYLPVPPVPLPPEP